MKLLLLTGMLIVSVTHFLGSRPTAPPKVVVAHTGDATARQEAALNGEWYLIPALASDTATGKLPFLRLDVRQKTFTGFSGCNQMSGIFKVTGDEIRFNENLVLSKKACAGYNEKEFVANLLRVDHYRISNGVLSMLIGQTPVARWTRKPGTGTVI